MFFLHIITWLTLPHRLDALYDTRKSSEFASKYVLIYFILLCLHVCSDNRSTCFGIELNEPIPKIDSVIT